MKSERLVRIGVFDSGVGGLTVLAACRRRMPGALYYYYGDNGRAPYGSRPRGEVLSFVREALDLFAALGTDAAVLACNTATAVCAETVRAAYPFPVIGTEPAIKPAAAVCKKVLVLATPLTAESARMKALCARFPACGFTVRGLPHLAAAIERMAAGGEPPRLSEHLPAGEYDGVVLGCTHYSFLRREIASFYGAPVFESGEGVARRLENLLSARFRKKSGTDDHFKPPRNPNDCLRKNSNSGGILFLGGSAEGNARVFSERTF